MATRKKTNQAALNRRSAANKRMSKDNLKWSDSKDTLAAGYDGWSALSKLRPSQSRRLKDTVYYSRSKKDPRYTSDSPAKFRASDAIVKPNVKKKAPKAPTARQRAARKTAAQTKRK